MTTFDTNDAGAVRDFNTIMRTVLKHFEPTVYYSDVIHDCVYVAKELPRDFEGQMSNRYMVVTPSGTHMCAAIGIAQAAAMQIGKSCVIYQVNRKASKFAEMRDLVLTPTGD